MPSLTIHQNSTSSTLESGYETGSLVVDRRFKRRGNRARIIQLLHKRPYNANQITQSLHLDYKTIRHHLEVMRKHQVITSTEEGYGSMYFLTEQMEANYNEFIEIWGQIDVQDAPRES